jgi:hypothetical protein
MDYDFDRALAPGASKNARPLEVSLTTTQNTKNTFAIIIIVEIYNHALQRCLR